jgi:peptidoglycan-associated lipoprotein
MKLRLIAASTVVCASMLVTACHKKTALAPPPAVPAPQQTASAPTPPPPAPAVTPAPQETSAPASRMPDAQTRAQIQDLLNRIEDAYFDYDKHEIRADAQKALVSDAHTLSEILKQYPDYKLTVEGHCDERGSDEYNIALGDARAKNAKAYLASLGIPENQLRTVSYGRGRPVCTEQTEACWQKNRRAHITQDQN